MAPRDHFYSLFDQCEEQIGVSRNENSGLIYIPESDEELEGVIERAKDCDPVAIRHVIGLRFLGGRSWTSEAERLRVRAIKSRWQEIVGPSRAKPANKK